MQGLTENHTLWRGLPVKRSYLLLLLWFCHSDGKENGAKPTGIFVLEEINREYHIYCKYLLPYDSRIRFKEQEKIG